MRFGKLIDVHVKVSIILIVRFIQVLLKRGYTAALVQSFCEEIGAEQNPQKFNFQKLSELYVFILFIITPIVLIGSFFTRIYSTARSCDSLLPLLWYTSLIFMHFRSVYI